MTTRAGQRSGTQALFGWLIPLVVVGLSIADFARDGQIDKFLIGALLIFGLGALGWRLDDIVGQKAAEQVNSAVDAARSSVSPPDAPTAPEPLPESGEKGTQGGP